MNDCGELGRLIFFSFFFFFFKFLNHDSTVKVNKISQDAHLHRYLGSHTCYSLDFFAFCQCIFSRGRVENPTIVIHGQISKKPMHQDTGKS